LMNPPTSRIAPVVIIILIALMLFACGAGIYASRSHLSTISPTTGIATPTPVRIGSPDPASANAQATIDAGQSQLSDLAFKATQVSLNMSQAADAAAQSTQDANQLQQLQLDQQATVIGLEIAHAAATQDAIQQQTKTAKDAIADAHSTAAAATQTANRINRALIAQAQVIVDGQVTQTAQAAAALTTYPLTATPLAATQAALLLTQYDREQKAFVDRIVVPAIPIVALILLLLLFILVISLAYRRVLPYMWPQRLRIGRVNANPLVMIDGVIAEHSLPLHHIMPSEPTPAALPLLPCEKIVHVEVVTSTEAPVAHWIAEVEQQLANAGGH
jgi:hypothetical protein